MTKQLLTFTSVLALTLGVLAAAHAIDERHSYAGSGCSHGTTSRLYLGQASRAGDVSESQWRAFVEEAVAPRFPAGFTELKANGHWRDDNHRAIEEDTRIVEITHDDSPHMRPRIRAIAVDYRQRFAQESVLITRFRTIKCFEDEASSAG